MKYMALIAIWNFIFHQLFLFPYHMLKWMIDYCADTVYEAKQTSKQIKSNWNKKE